MSNNVAEQLSQIVSELSFIRTSIQGNEVIHAEIIGKMNLINQNVLHLDEKVEDLSVIINGNGKDPLPTRLSLVETHVNDLKTTQKEIVDNQKESQKNASKNKTQIVVTLLGVFGTLCAAGVAGYFAYLAA